MKIAVCLALLILPRAGAGQDAEPKKAQDLLDAALKEAKEKQKRVLLTFGSPG